mmetsp:Transcript_24336/g.49338  ORF Transcript_24336/g.49338 Transcript_24336/m.49338 type:complete len:162 (+) Transcript_24336:2-487(+)
MLDEDRHLSEKERLHRQVGKAELLANQGFDLVEWEDWRDAGDVSVVFFDSVNTHVCACWENKIARVRLQRSDIEATCLFCTSLKISTAHRVLASGQDDLYLLYDLSDTLDGFQVLKGDPGLAEWIEGQADPIEMWDRDVDHLSSQSDPSHREFMVWLCDLQ